MLAMSAATPYASEEEMLKNGRLLWRNVRPLHTENTRTTPLIRIPFLTGLMLAVLLRSVPRANRKWKIATVHHFLFKHSAHAFAQHLYQYTRLNCSSSTATSSWGKKKNGAESYEQFVTSLKNNSRVQIDACWYSKRLLNGPRSEIK